MRKLKLILSSFIQIPFRLFSKLSLLALIENSSIHRTSSIKAGCRIYHSKIGKYTYIARNCTITHAKIGAFCSVADQVMISPGKHPWHFVSTSPVFYSNQNVLKECFNQVPFNEFDDTVIGNDVWIGSHAFIKGGITVGDGAVIGAFSVVTKDVEPYAIVAGNPARVIRKRFDDATVNKLLHSQWWTLDEKALRNEATRFSNVESFLKAI